MESFDLEAHLSTLYASYPEAPQQPLIGITANFRGEEACLREKYYDQVVKAGGSPVLIPPVADKNVLLNILERIDGLLLSGGADINPLWLDEEPVPQMGEINAARDLSELLLIRLAFNRQIPILGICRGIQAMAIAVGGSIAQDIGQTSVKHSQEGGRGEPTHSVTIDENSTVYTLYQQKKLFVNSVHHQAVSKAGNRFRVTAKASDGIIEAIESTEHKAVLGVQWHPEWLGKDGLPLFQWLVSQAENFHTAKRLHRHMLTLDTHCDTPMFFPEGIDFMKRDPKILVDLHKMTEGRLDATTMVAYLPQPKAGESFASKVAFPVSSPTEYADLIFDKIETIVRENSRYLGLARSPEQLYKLKRQGRKAIVLGIENGLALGGDLSNVAHFAQRGITYITLCHNGDNDICDSARGNGTHGGVSDFGAKVIAEMNRLGIMVDLSHGGEKSFYDALDISRMPIVCSHSNCKELCDVPRNLTDDQLRALARKGGVAHTTLYKGFLRKEGQASILDAVAHLEHAIKIMGIEHVGIGTDFDGDGGVPGMADASEAIAFTLQLLRHRYNEEDIARIWGKNWLRVMTEVQAACENQTLRM